MTEMDDGEFLQMLSLRGFRLCIPEGVIHEVKKEPGKSRLSKALREKWISVYSTPKAEYDFFKKRYPMLDYAEVEVIQKGLESKHSGSEYCCVLDEGAGRKVAESLGLNKIGTEGLLVVMNHSGVINDSIMKKLLNKLGQSSFRPSGSNIGAKPRLN